MGPIGALGDAPRLLIMADATEVATGAAERIAAALTGAVAARGVAHWATTGGSSAPGIYRALADPPLRDTIPWPDVHVWWGDDRFVARDDALSNVKPLDDILVGAVPLAPAHLHPIRMAEAIATHRGAVWAAETLTAELRAADLETLDGVPVLDLVVLGVGGDGHILSVFPGSTAFYAQVWAMAIPAPTHIEPHVERVTMQPGVVGAARDVLVVATGAGKVHILADIFGPIHDPRRWPAQLALHQRATWILDEAAAARLPR